MRRREFIALVGGAAVAWPVVARAQQGERMRHVGVLMNTTSSNPVMQGGLAIVQKALQQSGWTDGGNIRFEIRWAGGEAHEIRRHAAELVALEPDVILATGTAGMGPLLQATRVVPIVSTASPILSARVLSRAWRAPAATPQDSSSLNTP